MSVWEDHETRGNAHLWRRPVDKGFNYVVTDGHNNNFPTLGAESGYADAETAWAAYEERRGIEREVDLNEM